MKAFVLSISLLAYTLNAKSQCISQPSCVHDITLTCTDISNQSVNGSPCFNGNGFIPTSFNINNADFYTFSPGGADSMIHCYQNINFQNGPKKAFMNAGTTVLASNTSMDG